MSAMVAMPGNLLVMPEMSSSEIEVGNRVVMNGMLSHAVRGRTIIQITGYPLAIGSLFGELVIFAVCFREQNWLAIEEHVCLRIFGF